MIFNQTKDLIISKKERICNSLFSQALGLMFRKKQNLVMIFNKEKAVQLHNFFVFYPIDILILNKSQEIIEIKRNFKPFTFYNSKKEGQYLLELAYPNEYQIGDKLEIR